MALITELRPVGFGALLLPSNCKILDLFHLTQKGRPLRSILFGCYLPFSPSCFQGTVRHFGPPFLGLPVCSHFSTVHPSSCEPKKDPWDSRSLWSTLSLATSPQSLCPSGTLSTVFFASYSYFRPICLFRFLAPWHGRPFRSILPWCSTSTSHCFTTPSAASLKRFDHCGPSFYLIFIIRSKPLHPRRN